MGWRRRSPALAGAQAPIKRTHEGRNGCTGDTTSATVYKRITVALAMGSGQYGSGGLLVVDCPADATAGGDGVSVDGDRLGGS